jgi:Ca-activated chloride channel family protein
MEEFLQNFHFLYPIYLILAAFLIVFYAFYFKNKNLFINKSFKELTKFASVENLKILLKQKITNKNKIINLFIILFLILVILAIAAPRWNYQEITAYKYSKNLVIILDASNSMSATDISPSRFIRAKQEIYDILQKFPSYRIGIIAFAKIPHIISPLTLDHQYINQNIQAITPNDFTLQGSNLNDAFNLALSYFNNIKNGKKYILLISDGDFTSNLQPQIINKLKKQQFNLAIYAVGTKKGAPVFKDGNILEYQGKKVVSKLNIANLENLAKNLSSPIINLNYNDSDLKEFSNFITNKDDITQSNTNIKQWQERFYIFLIPAMLIFIYLFAKNILLIFIILFIYAPNHAKAGLFMNKEQRAEKLFEEKKYDQAEKLYQTPYNKGVSAYRNKNYDLAIKNFEQIINKNTKTKFNLANSHLQKKLYQEAINIYEDILTTNPQDKKTQHNLAIAKKLLEKKQQQKQDNNKKKDNKEKSSQEKKDNKEKSPQEKKDNKEKSPQEKKDNKEKSPQEKKDNKEKSPQEKKDNKEKSPQEKKDNFFNLIETRPGELLKQKIRQKELLNKNLGSKSNKNPQKNSHNIDKPW